jgi:tRNA_anti-like
MNDQDTVQQTPPSKVRRVAGIITIIAAVVLALVVGFVVMEKNAKNKAMIASLNAVAEQNARLATPEYTATGALRISAAELLRRVQADKQAAQILMNKSAIEMHGNLTVENGVGLNGTSLNFQTDDRAVPVTAGIDAAYQAQAAKLAGAAQVTVRCGSANIFTDSPMLMTCSIIEN